MFVVYLTIPIFFNTRICLSTHYITQYKTGILFFNLKYLPPPLPILFSIEDDVIATRVTQYIIL